MATGDSNDMVLRLKLLLPQSWFASDNTPVLNSLLAGLAAPLAWIYSLYLYTVQQMRLATASGVWLDRISYDFLGNRLPRKTTTDPNKPQTVVSAEPDNLFRVRIKNEILRPRQTRDAVIKVLTDLTGNAPQINEPWHPGDNGAYGQSVCGYGLSGYYGSLALNNQFFVTAVRPPGVGVPNVSGYGGPGLIGYGVQGQYIDLSQITGPVLDSEIYGAVAHTIAAGMTAWVDIVDKLPAPRTLTNFTADKTSPTADTNIVTADEY